MKIHGFRKNDHQLLKEMRNKATRVFLGKYKYNNKSIDQLSYNKQYSFVSMKKTGFFQNNLMLL